ncbi:MAG: hypothetical protein ACHQ0Y_10875, partial [Thermodesulfovibrionales bacterium]
LLSYFLRAVSAPTISGTQASHCHSGEIKRLMRRDACLKSCIPFYYSSVLTYGLSPSMLRLWKLILKAL